MDEARSRKCSIILFGIPTSLSYVEKLREVFYCLKIDLLCHIDKAIALCNNTIDMTHKQENILIDELLRRSEMIRNLYKEDMYSDEWIAKHLNRTRQTILYRRNKIKKEIAKELNK